MNIEVVFLGGFVIGGGLVWEELYVVSGVISFVSLILRGICYGVVYSFILICVILGL